MIETLKECGKAINVKFDVLNESFLMYIKKNGCKVLHLTPFMVKLKNEDFLIIEKDSSFLSYSLTTKQLKKMLKDKDGSKKISEISLVILELTNCSEFA